MITSGKIGKYFKERRTLYSDKWCHSIPYHFASKILSFHEKKKTYMEV